MDQLLAALTNLLSLSHLLYLCLGVLIGLVVGILPGLGGLAGLSILLPFVYGMDPVSALAMMIGLLAPTTTSDTFPAVLMGIPGTAASQATVLDGFPMAQRGEGARALAAAFTASMFGGVFGALMLTVAVFVAEPIILSIGFAEQMALMFFALTMIGMLTGASPLKGLAAGGLGLMIGVIGAAPATGEERLTFGSIYLLNGIPIVIVGLGMFALPEIVDLLRRSTFISKAGMLGHGWTEGFRDALRHKWLVLRCSVIGCLVGALPGLGGSVVDWIAYGHAVQTTKNPERYGTGDVRGVLAPESANNAKEGGAMIPTLLFGIPGSGSMAILLGGFVLVGVTPGVNMVTEHLDLTYTMIWSLALANILGTVICLFIANPVARLTTIRYALLAPCMIVIIFFAAFQASKDWNDLLCMLCFGLLGLGLKRFGWPRSALLIGFFLSTQVEASTYQAIQVYGWSFFQRPIVLAIFALTAFSIYAAIRKRPNKPKGELAVQHSPWSKKSQVAFTLFIFAITTVVLVDGVQRDFLAALFPVTVSALTLLMVLPMLIGQMRGTEPSNYFYDEDIGMPSGSTGTLHYIAWIVGLLLASALVGFQFAVGIFVLAFLTVKAGDSLRRNCLIAGCLVGLLELLAHLLVLEYPAGLLQQFVKLPSLLGG